MRKHAYLIIAHHNFNQLSKLLRLLDDDRNDIFLHVDKKCRHVPFELLKGSVKEAGLYFASRTNVSWGGYSQINAEIILLKRAISGKYAYYHLISGEDLPLKSQNYIHDFFDKHEGKEFIAIDEYAMKTGNFYERFVYYHFLQEITVQRNSFCFKVLKRIDNSFTRLQNTLSVDRQKNKHRYFYKGSNWFSITHSLAEYIISREDFITKNFRYSIACDEVFLPSIAMNSPYKDNLYHSHARSHMRYIDWERGRPYTFTQEDFEMLISREELFARKFNEEIDGEIIDMIYEYVRKATRT